MLELTDVIKQMDLIFHQSKKKKKRLYFLCATHETFSKTDHILGNKV